MGTRRRIGVLALVLGVGLSCVPASAGPVEAEADQVRAYFFGDSLMAGTGASPRRPVMARMAAARLGWDVEVDAWGGTGYTTGGARPAYVDRLRAPGALSGTYDVVLVEGGTNDWRSAGDPDAVRAAVEDVVDEVRRRQPQAQIVLMGAYDPPASGAVRPGRAVVDDVVQEVAEAEGLAFFSPLSGGWAQDQPPTFLHPDRLHPNDEGYAVMGARLTAELAALQVRAAEPG